MWLTDLFKLADFRPCFGCVETAFTPQPQLALSRHVMAAKLEQQYIENGDTIDLLDDFMARPSQYA